MKKLYSIFDHIGWRNANGTSKDVDNTCGSWKQHYIEETGLPWPDTCRHRGCNNIAEDGCHIFNPTKFGTKVYIVPLCKACNHIKGPFSLKNNTVLSDLEDEEKTKDK